MVLRRWQRELRNEEAMKQDRPQSYAVGPYIVRRDATQHIWRVFTGGLCIYHSHLLSEALHYAEQKTEQLRAIYDNY